MGQTSDAGVVERYLACLAVNDWDGLAATVAIAGTAAQCRDMMMAYAREGVTELVLTMLGTQPVEDMQYLSNVLELA